MRAPRRRLVFATALGGVALALGGGDALAAQTLQSEVALDVRTVGEKMVALAEAIPAEDYDWRPAPGVRSVSEVFMHMAAANVGLPVSLLGAPLPAGYTADWASSAEEITDKAEVIRHLEAAFEHLATTVESLTDARLAESVTVFGRATNRMGALLLLQSHGHEHLGQAIAYARMNGVVPPWSG